MGDGLTVIRVRGRAREASGLLAVTSRPLLEARGWDAAFWTVLDEGPVEQATMLIGRSAGDWTLEYPDFAVQPRKTADGEALARHREHVYVFGSHFGGKSGLDAKRAFAARFREDDLVAADAEQVALEVWHDDFELHRSVNDALARSGVELLPIRKKAREQFIEQALKTGGGRIRDDDVPLNIEGIAFRPSGDLVLGLRCPVTEDGHPIVVELAGYAQNFGGELPPVSGVWTLGTVRAKDAAVGIRDLEAETDGETFSLIAGGLDKEVLRKKDRRNAGFAHWQATIPARQDDSPVPCRFVRELPEDVERIEGVARDPDGGYVYLSDDEKRVVLLVGG